MTSKPEQTDPKMSLAEYKDVLIRWQEERIRELEEAETKKKLNGFAADLKELLAKYDVYIRVINEGFGSEINLVIGNREYDFFALWNGECVLNRSAEI